MLSIETGIAPQHLLDPAVSDIVDEMLAHYTEEGDRSNEEALRQELRQALR